MIWAYQNKDQNLRQGKVAGVPEHLEPPFLQWSEQSSAFLAFGNSRGLFQKP